MSAGSLPGGSADAASAARREASAGAASAETSADTASAARPDASADTSAELASRAERRRRMLALAGVTVHGSDGKTVGRVRDVYLQDATGELAAITVMPRQLSARSVLLPAAAIAALPQEPQAAQEPDGADADHEPDGTDEGQEPHGTEVPHSTEDHVLHLRVDARTAKAGVRPPLTLHATPDVLEAAVAALHLEEGPARA